MAMATFRDFSGLEMWGGERLTKQMVHETRFVELR
jgi:hypothetical protein